MVNYDSTLDAALFKRINDVLIKYNDSNNGSNLVVSIIDYNAIKTADNQVLCFNDGKRQMNKVVALNDYTEFLRPVIRRNIATGEPEVNSDGSQRYTSLMESMECVFSCLREMQLEEDVKT